MSAEGETRFTKAKYFLILDKFSYSYKGQVFMNSHIQNLHKSYCT